jgi:hypothetical protein
MRARQRQGHRGGRSPLGRSRHNALIHTTCVATTQRHAPNALPQRASERELPHPPRSHRRGGEVDAGVARRSKIEVALDEREVAGPRRVSAQMYPGVPVVPTMSSGATDNITGSPAFRPTARTGSSAMSTTCAHTGDERLA